MEKHLEQGSAEWLKMRKNFIMASDAPAIMGKSPWKSEYDVWEDKMGLSAPTPDNYAMQRGRELEPIAREAYQQETGHIVEPKVVFHKEISFMGASLDGITSDHSVAVEIKCPGEKDHSLAKEGTIPDKYLPQLFHQMEVIGLDKIHYYSYRDGDTALIELERDDEYVSNLLIKESQFWEKVQNLIEPDKKEDDTISREDEEWDQASNYWKQKNDVLKIAAQEEKEAKEKLIAISNGKSTFGCGVKLTKSVRQGTVNYSIIPELKDIDLSKYRKENTISWRLSQLRSS